jgi:hypothetical protein
LSVNPMRGSEKKDTQSTDSESSSHTFQYREAS